MAEKLILARRRVNPIDFRRVSAALVHYWRDLEGADQVSTQAALERHVLDRVQIDERTFRSVLYDWWRRGLIQRDEAGPTIVLCRLSADVANPLWRRFCPALDERVAEPLVLAGNGGSFHLMGRPPYARSAAGIRWQIPAHRLYVGAWAWAQSWQCAIGEGRIADPGLALVAVAEAAQKALFEMVWDHAQQPAASTLQARIIQAFRGTPTQARVIPGTPARRFWQRQPGRLCEAARDALDAVEHATGNGAVGSGRFLGSWLRWLAELRVTIRRHLLDASPSPTRNRFDSPRARWRQLEVNVRSLDPEVRYTLRQSERAFGWPFLRGAGRPMTHANISGRTAAGSDEAAGAGFAFGGPGGPAADRATANRVGPWIGLPER